MAWGFNTSRLAAWHIEGNTARDADGAPPIANAISILGRGVIETALAGAVDPTSFSIARFRARLPDQFLRHLPPYPSIVALLVERVQGEGQPPTSDAISLPTMAGIRKRLAGIYHKTTLPALAEAAHEDSVSVYEMLVNTGHLVIPSGERPPAIREHFIATPSDPLSFFPQAAEHIPPSLQP
jgi:hypothetical protein